MMRNRFMGVLRDREGDTGGGGGGIDVNKLVEAVTSAVVVKFDARFDELAKVVKPKEKEPEPPPKKGEKDDGDLAALRKQVNDLKAAKEESDRRAAEREKEAEQKERHSMIRGMLGGFEWASKSAAASAFKIVVDEIRRAESGELVGPDGTPAEEWIAKQIDDEHDYLLKPKQVSGSGATNGGKKEKPVDLNDIKPGMSAEDLARVRAEIARLAR